MSGDLVEQIGAPVRVRKTGPLQLERHSLINTIPARIVIIIFQLTGAKRAVTLTRTWSPIMAGTESTRHIRQLLGTDRGAPAARSAMAWSRTTEILILARRATRSMAIGSTRRILLAMTRTGPRMLPFQ